MLTTRWQPLGTVWPEMNRLQEEMQQWLRRAGMNDPRRSAQSVYPPLNVFYSDMFDLGYEAVGEVDSRLETFTDWKRPNEEGVIYCLQHARVRGVLLWNVWDQVEAARQLIAEPGPFTIRDLKGRLPAKTSSPKRDA